jgi:hypothetical protein
MAGGYAFKRVQLSGGARCRKIRDKNDYWHVAESLQYLLVGGGEALLLVKRENHGPRPGLAVMELGVIAAKAAKE